MIVSLQQQMGQVQQQIGALQIQPQMASSSSNQHYQNVLPQFTSSEQTEPLAPQMNLITPQKHLTQVAPPHTNEEQQHKGRSSSKKELPPRKNWLHRQETEEDPPALNMQGGIRGLLAKSKGKERTPSAEPVRRGLPQVKQDHNSNKRRGGSLLAL